MKILFNIFIIKKLILIIFKISNDLTETIIEQGVLFNLVIDDQLKSDGQHSSSNSSKVKEMNFWVVGRRKMQRLNPSTQWTNLGDFFVCFNDSIDQLLLELAFDVGFGKLTI